MIVFIFFIIILTKETHFFSPKESPIMNNISSIEPPSNYADVCAFVRLMCRNTAATRVRV